MIRDKIIDALQTVKDPEIDSVSIIELGMLDEVKITSNDVLIKLLPTFMGCPALDIIKNNVVKAVLSIDEVEKVDVKFIFHPPWTSDRVTDLGREKLKEFGIAPPPRHITETGEWQADCPYCGSTYTTMENLFGPTACRSILYCKSCKNPFEAMKPVSTLM
ncbi:MULTISPECIES: 1,2-phenylacetyl-CoA epoxidase subunit PaaD [Mesobacillus]|uniref:1,2-phenylacetyl-CoA epoxidase subunit PaaD n=1 Tax=Mesobacillus TaxID=2675231 RepID=UPI0017866599|nr:MULTISPECIES: 1,2-phenylacetyl-CoA epoxidase subunit PaaD [Mesobacillus]MCM3572654.1 phenylacetate-CoA oxygenase subunit PaaJ [Mesobacillus subterraneus]UYZ23718.1 phenylacetate-CoA oxygenase subunit PaaJ [Mesobacillus jeotgali]